MKTIVSTMPIKPQKQTNIGMMIAPTLMEYLGDSLKANKILATNTLNTYTEKDLELFTYINDVSANGIIYDEIFNDKKETSKILTIIQDMIDKNIITLTTEKIMKCPCSRVDILESAIRDFSDGKLYKKDESGKYICSFCGKECKTYTEKVLTLPFEKEKMKKIEITPIFLEKEIKQFEKNFNQSKILVSKTRDTGYYAYKDGKKYNIDIDFIWMNFPHLLEADRKILIASNHQLLKMFIMNYVNRASIDQNLTFIAHPYMKSANMEIIQKIYNQIPDVYFKKLFILYQLNWNKKTCNYSDSIIKYLSSISNTRRFNLYRNIIELSQDFCSLQNDYNDHGDFITKMIKENINMQKNIEDSKKYVKKR